MFEILPGIWVYGCRVHRPKPLERWQGVSADKFVWAIVQCPVGTVWYSRVWGYASIPD